MTPIIILKTGDKGTRVNLASLPAIQAAFLQEAANWLGVKYRHRGTTMRGCDCTGLIIGVCRKLGYLGRYDLRMYPEDWNLHAGAGNYICEELDKVGNEIPKNSACDGDIAIFRFGKCLAHAGIIVDIKKRLMIHSFLTAKKCKYAILRNSLWSKRWEKSYRLDNEKMAKYS